MLDGARDLLDRLEARPNGPAIPAIEDHLAPLLGRLIVDLLEREPDSIGTRRFEVHSREPIEC